MTIDCQWISKNLESVFCDRLTDDLDCGAREHISKCEHCQAEVQALIGVDSLIKKYFQQQLALASAPPKHRRMSRLYGLAAAGAAAIFVLVLMQRPAEIPIHPPNPPMSQRSAPVLAPTAPANASVKSPVAAENERAKPSSSRDGTAAIPTDTQPSATIRPAPDFIVFDPAGYATTLASYRGYVLVIGIWDNEHPDATQNLERLYKAFGSKSRLRFMGVSDQREVKPSNTTFPTFYNHGSKLLGALAGDFILVDETGAVRLRGSLTGNFGDLQQQLESR